MRLTLLYNYVRNPTKDIKDAIEQIEDRIEIFEEEIENGNDPGVRII